MILDIATSRKTWPRELKGKQCIVYKEGDYLDDAKKHYGRENQDNLCLKIFNVPMEGTLEEYYWGNPWRSLTKERCEEIGIISRLREATIIQNICAMYNYAPRVYALFTVTQNEKKYPVQLVEFIEGEQKKDLDRYDEMSKLGDEYGFLPCHTDLTRDNDFIGGKLIDFQGFRFDKNFKQETTIKIAELGRYGNYHYQSVPELGLRPHPRDTTKRIDYMNLKGIDFKGKSVLDVGCSNGVFCNYAVENGAKTVLGIDLEKPVLASKLLSNYLGHFNIDYWERDLKIEITPFFKFDIVFFLSMNLHVGFPKWIKNATKELLVFEENARASEFQPEFWTEELKRDFKEVTQIGYAFDHGAKPIYWCRR